jgi:hypothetical protein
MYILNFMRLCVCVCVYVCVHACVWGSSGRAFAVVEGQNVSKPNVAVSFREVKMNS